MSVRWSTFAPFDLLGRHVERRAHHRAGLRVDVARVREQLGDAEVEHLHEIRIAAARDEENIVGLEIAMDDAASVRRAERFANAPSDVRGARDRRSLALQEIRKALPLEPFHHDVRRAVAELAEVEDVDDVLVLDVRRGFGLVEETRDDLRAATQVRQEHLHRDAPPEPRVLGDVDRAHSAFADLAANDVVTDRLSNHRGRA